MEVFIEKSWSHHNVKFFAKVEMNGGEGFLTQKGRHIAFHQIDPMDPSQPFEPLLELPRGIAQDFIKAIVKEANNQGIQTENESALKGKLEATEKHLSDLRDSSNSLFKLISKQIDISDPRRL